MQNIRGDAIVDLRVPELRPALPAWLPFKAISLRFEQFALQRMAGVSPIETFAALHPTTGSKSCPRNRNMRAIL